MKNVLIIILILSICVGVVFFGIGSFNKTGGDIINDNTLEITAEEDFFHKKPELKAVWLTYYEISDMCLGKTEAYYKSACEELLKNLCECRINTVFYQARAFADAFYYSKSFPVSEYISENGDFPKFDPLEVFISCAEKYDISVHAWINPFRVSYKSDINTLPEHSPVKKLYESDSSSVIVCEKGIYLAPSSQKSTRLILDGIRELISCYNIKGVQFDDYFYPPCEFSGDGAAFDEYSENNASLTIEDFRRSCVSEFISAVYGTVKLYNEELLFGVSPSAKLEYNKNTIFADVELWCSEDGYIDYIMPQIYYGFENEIMPFSKVAELWRELVKNESVELYAGLALYKAGGFDENAGSGKNEWQANADTLSRQYKELINIGYDGFSLFSCKYFSAENSSDFSEKEIKALRDVLE